MTVLTFAIISNTDSDFVFTEASSDISVPLVSVASFAIPEDPKTNYQVCEIKTNVPVIEN